ncbi:MAG: hypothetical protein JXA01_08495 [Dehalococcoidia bacterium]|nr:hypothetical protein [Dehalococcoidia bacterium]
MSDQPITSAGTIYSDPAGNTGQDRLESLISALIELRSNIAGVEQSHPSFSNDLSSLCDTVIEHLCRPEEAAPLQDLQPCGSLQPGLCNSPYLETLPEKVTTNPPDHAALPAASQSKPNFLAAIFDRAGDGMIKGLDKMGDGVIFVFEKLLSLGPRKKTRANQDPV